MGLKHAVIFISLFACISSSGTEVGSSYTTVFEITELQQIPRYHQVMQNTDTNLCFAASAVQALDLIRYRRLRAAGQLESFVPSSPLLMAARFYHLRDTPIGLQGGDPAGVLLPALNMGNCESPVTGISNSFFSTEDEVNALTQRMSVDSVRDGKLLIDQILTGQHRQLFQRTYQQCRIGSASSQNDGGQFEIVNVIGTPAIDSDVWQTTLNQAMTVEPVPQAVILGLCAEAILNLPFRIREEKPPTQNEGELEIPACSNHFVVVYGKRCERNNNRNCQLLIRDSYTSSQDVPARNSTVPVNYQGYSSDYWVSEEQIRLGTMTMLYLRHIPKD